MPREIKLVKYKDLLSLCLYTQAQSFERLKTISHHTTYYLNNECLINVQDFLLKQRLFVHSDLNDIFGLFPTTEKAMCPQWYMNTFEYSVCYWNHSSDKAVTSPSREKILIPDNDKLILFTKDEDDTFTKDMEFTNKSSHNELEYIIFSPDEKFVAATSKGKEIDLLLWKLDDVSNFSLTHNSITLCSYYGEDSPIVFSLDGYFLYVVHASNTERNILRFNIHPFDMNILNPKAITQPSRDRYLTLKISSDHLITVRQRENCKKLEVIDLKSLETEI